MHRKGARMWDLGGELIHFLISLQQTSFWKYDANKADNKGEIMASGLRLRDLGLLSWEKRGHEIL